MDFNQIEAFANVVKYRSFSKAADASFLTQPTISAHIRSLEKELGMTLLNRKSNNVTPTMQGKIFYRYAISMINTRSKAIYSLQNLTSDLSGVIEIQTSSIPGQYLVPKLISAFAKEHPMVKFYIDQSDSSQVFDNLSNQKGDMGFTGNKNASHLTSELMLKEPVVLIAPDKGKFAKVEGNSVKIRDFIDQPFIWREEGSATRKEFEKALGEKGFSVKSMKVVARMNSMEAIKQVVASGLGIAILSKMATEHIVDGCGIRCFDIEDFKDEREFYFVYNKTITLSPSAEIFKDFILDMIKNGKLTF